MEAGRSFYVAWMEVLTFIAIGIPTKMALGHLTGVLLGAGQIACSNLREDSAIVGNCRGL